MLEIDLCLDPDSDEPVKLWVTLRDRSLLMFEGVWSNPTRAHGVWAISHEFLGRRATSFVPAEDVRYFTMLEPASDAGAGERVLVVSGT